MNELASDISVFEFDMTAAEAKKGGPGGLDIKNHGENHREIMGKTMVNDGFYLWNNHMFMMIMVIYML